MSKYLALFMLTGGKRLEMPLWNQKHIMQPATCSTAYTTDHIDKGSFLKTI